MARPRQKVRRCLEKARDAALLAVEIYNKPAVTFRSGGYISMMIIAWTAAMHAVFLKKKIKPYYKGLNGRYERIDGDLKWWELATCIKQYFGSNTNDPVRLNLEFFIPLRNKIEHRSFPELDGNLFGECQAMLLNFDEFVEVEFGSSFCLRESLTFALQLFPSSENLVQAVKRNKDARSLAEFIREYRSSISQEVSTSSKYAFKAFLIQVANHASSDVLPIQFVNYDKLSTSEKQEVSKIAALVKLKEVPVTNKNLMRPSAVAKRVQAALGNQVSVRGGKQVPKFSETVHTLCWKKYKVRPASKSSTPTQTDTRYCVYDEAHNDYLYTPAWVDFLGKRLSDPAEFNSLFKPITLQQGAT